PVVWVLLAGSRMVAQWFQLEPAVETANQYLEGSPLDRFIFSALLAAGLIVLLARRRWVGTFLRANGPILLFFLYCAASVLWSDYPDVAFKRWIKGFGNVVMVLVVLTDANPSAALKRFLSRSGFLLIPLSVLLIKYYPDLGQGYNPWTWDRYYIGVATGKNGLGFVCLVFGLGSLWRFLEAFQGGERARSARPLIAHGTIVAMALWLFWKADSATSFGCFLMGAGLLVVTSWPALARSPKAIHLLVGAPLCVSLVGLLLNGWTDVVAVFGRDPTLTGRTLLWNQLLGMTVNPLFGTGFESFWLGGRMEMFWRMYWWHPNQAHNGYLEIFLNLGWMGLALLGLVMVWGYRNVVAAFRLGPEAGRIRLSYFVVAAVYNLTEAAFQGIHVVWIMFLLVITVVPEGPPREDVIRTEWIPTLELGNSLDCPDQPRALPFLSSRQEAAHLLPRR
ncbi:MAG TPA: O-antigen ligase family protein, partial [Terriglobales bacterium]|nr:O-antigen ligase family protein [Terriglobales bacterium]